MNDATQSDIRLKNRIQKLRTVPSSNLSFVNPTPCSLIAFLTCSALHLGKSGSKGLKPDGRSLKSDFIQGTFLTPSDNLMVSISSAVKAPPTITTTGTRRSSGDRVVLLPSSEAGLTASPRSKAGISVLATSTV